MTMKTLRIRTRLCLTLLMCMLFVGKSVAQEEGEPPHVVRLSGSLFRIDRI